MRTSGKPQGAAPAAAAEPTPGTAGSALAATPAAPPPPSPRRPGRPRGNRQRLAMTLWTTAEEHAALQAAAAAAGQTLGAWLLTLGQLELGRAARRKPKAGSAR